MFKTIIVKIIKFEDIDISHQVTLFSIGIWDWCSFFHAKDGQVACEFDSWLINLELIISNVWVTVAWQCWWENGYHTKLCAKVSELTGIKFLTKINLWVIGSACGLFGICHSWRHHQFKFWSFSWLWTEGFSACAQLHTSSSWWWNSWGFQWTLLVCHFSPSSLLAFCVWV